MSHSFFSANQHSLLEHRRSFARPPKDATRFKSRSQRSKSNARRTILVADDDDDTREMLGTLLRAKGYRVVEASNGRDAIEVTLREAPGLVLLDLSLPVVNGLSVIRRLRDEFQFVDVPLVIVSGYDEHFETALAAGCNEYLTKPVDFERLDALLKRYVPIRAMGKSA